MRSAVLLTALFCPLVAVAADNVPVYTDPENVDDDFAFQGEYRGWQAPLGSARSREAVGLQVIALGNGKFDAVKYYGGLPGEGWRQDKRYTLSGSLENDLVILPGDTYDIVLDGRVAVVTNRRGQRVGELRKVHRVSPTLGAAPPPGAIVLFSGDDNGSFKNPKITPEGWLEAGTETTGAWNRFRLHGEFRLPYKPTTRGQARGNSGFYLQGRYEVQVLDSFGLEGIENECGALYKTRRPDINMCYPPLTWQTYDIDFTAPKFDDEGNKISDMRISVWHNGVLIHNNVSIPNKTGAGKPEEPHPLPTKLQDHGNPVVYRNLWLVDLSDTSHPPATGLAHIPRRVPPMPMGSYHAHALPIAPPGVHASPLVIAP